MSEEHAIDDKNLTRFARHRFLILIVGTIVISLFLVAVALALYASSGAAQLDLSRPGYTSVREQAVQTDKLDSFPASGPMNEDTIKQFRALYDKQAQEATNVDSFGGHVMSDQALSIDAPPATGDPNTTGAQ